MAKAKKTSGKSGGLPLKPGLVVIAIMCLRAAATQPSWFSIPSIAVWLAGALATGLVAYAVLALALPVGAILLAYIRRGLTLLSRPAGEG
ncbi:hypothetical protein [Acidocella facilis]|uniref:hypothetical protein n=1 Tax=Acidocella facilis TaxID=525 RepID=UPI001F3EE7AC|nr:hypothetical protein [Acidocella facilis]